MCGTTCGPCQVNAVDLSYLVYVLAVLLTVLDVANMLALSILSFLQFQSVKVLKDCRNLSLSKKPVIQHSLWKNSLH